MSASTCERDFDAWIEETVSHVRAGRLDAIDREIPIEELGRMGKRDRRELLGRLVVPIAHLLTWAHQPEGRRSGWIGSFAEQRLQIQGQLDDSPSRRAPIPETLVAAYPKSVALAAKATGLPQAAFPPELRLGLDLLLDDDWYPQP
jgi:hypothetical protein